MMAVIGTLAFNFQVVIPLIATKTFGKGAGANRAAPVVHGPGRGARWTVGRVAASGVSYKPVDHTRDDDGRHDLDRLGGAVTLATEAVALFAMGAAAFAFIAVANTTIQLTAAPEMRGRVMALYAIAFLGSTPIGGPIVGWISQVYGPRIGFALGGVAAIGAAVVGGLVAARGTAPRRCSSRASWRCRAA